MWIVFSEAKIKSLENTGCTKTALFMSPNLDYIFSVNIFYIFTSYTVCLAFINTAYNRRKFLNHLEKKWSCVIYR